MLRVACLSSISKANVQYSFLVRHDETLEQGRPGRFIEVQLGSDIVLLCVSLCLITLILLTELVRLGLVFRSRRSRTFDAFTLLRSRHSCYWPLDTQR